MKYVIFTFDGFGLPIAKRLQDEGMEVQVGMIQDHHEVLSELEKKVKGESAEERRRRLALYEGLTATLPAERLLGALESQRDTENTFIFFDANHSFRYAERLHDLGYRGNFPFACDYDLEIDREAAKNFVEREYPRVRVARKKRFTSAAEGKAFLDKTEDLWVLKGLEEGARTVVPDVTEPDLAKVQLLDALAQHREEYESAGFILELLIPNAIELTPQKVYFDGEAVYCALCIENKPMGAGNVGPMTDCAQDLVFATEPGDRINEIAFPPIVDEMARKRRGLFYWDASLLVDSRSGAIYFGEFCSNRVGFNCFFTELALSESVSNYFESILQGKAPYEGNSVGVSVRLFNYHRDEQGLPLSGSTVAFTDTAERELWLTDVRIAKGRVSNPGSSDTLGVATGTGRSVGEAARRAYRAIDQFSFDGAFYRPMFDLLSREYKSSILNRLDYGLARSFYKVGFGIG